MKKAPDNDKIRRKASAESSEKQAQKVRQMESRIARLDENIKAMRDIEEAKHLIMKRKSLSGNEAYRLLRDLAMEKRVTVAEIAEKLVDSSDLLT